MSHAVDQRSKQALDDYIALVFMGPHSHDLLYVLELHDGSWTNSFQTLHDLIQFIPGHIY